MKYSRREKKWMEDQTAHYQNLGRKMKTKMRVNRNGGKKKNDTNTKD
jgi:hypothetical protein